MPAQATETLRARIIDFPSVEAANEARFAQHPQLALSLPRGFGESALSDLSVPGLSHRRLKEGQALYRSGESFDSLYVIRAGFIKTVAMLEDGREQVIGFYMPCEMFGLDGIAPGRHWIDAVALVNSEICAIPYYGLKRCQSQSPAIQQLLNRMFSREIVREQQMLLMLGSMRAEERVAAFLLDLSERYGQLGFSSSEFILRLTRQEIGSLLGLKLETVSRIFSRFDKNGLIEVEARQVRIVSSEGLRRVLGNSRM
jgi:CRP/FNR family transcriptional regulator, anaerobic regulatory protein